MASPRVARSNDIPPRALRLVSCLWLSYRPMSKDELHDIANRDAPLEVQIPNTWQGLMVWALARFGVGILVAAVFGYATMIVYVDMRADRAELFSAYQQTTKVIEEVSAGMRDNTEAVRKNTEAIEEAHRRAVNRTN